MENRILKCQCGAHMIEDDYDEECGEHILVFWKLGGDNEDSLWSRVKTAYKMLFFGKSYQTEIVLSSDDAEKLGELLINKKI